MYVRALCFVGGSLLVAVASAGAQVEGHIRAAQGIEALPVLSVAVDAWACAPDGALEDPRLRIGKDMGIADVVVRIVDGSGVAPAYPVQGTVVLDQKGCVFRPHVVVVAPGQELVVRNSDPVLHTFRTIARSNRTINRAQVKGREDTFRFDKPEIIRVECDVHHWMSAVVVVAENAWTAVTSANGEFRIDDVPPGAYEIELWHKTLGTRTTRIEVDESGGSLIFEWSPPASDEERDGNG